MKYKTAVPCLGFSLRVSGICILRHTSGALAWQGSLGQPGVSRLKAVPEGIGRHRSVVPLGEEEVSITEEGDRAVLGGGRRGRMLQDRLRRAWSPTAHLKTSWNLHSRLILCLVHQAVSPPTTTCLGLSSRSETEEMEKWSWDEPSKLLPHMAEKAKYLSLASCMRVLITFTRTEPCDLISSQRPHLLKPPQWRVVST